MKYASVASAWVVNFGSAVVDSQYYVLRRPRHYFRFDGERTLGPGRSDKRAKGQIDEGHWVIGPGLTYVKDECDHMGAANTLCITEPEIIDVGYSPHEHSTLAS